MRTVHARSFFMMMIHGFYGSALLMLAVAASLRAQSLPVVLAAGRFTDNGDGTVADASGGLMWQQICIGRTLSWEEAWHAADTLTLGGFTDWRLPTIDELRSIVSAERMNPAVELLYFPCIGESDRLWSSTPAPDRDDEAWMVAFGAGAPGYASKSTALKVLAVRGGIGPAAAPHEAGLARTPVLHPIAPHPASGNVVIGYTVPAGPVRLTIVDRLGKVVKKWERESVAGGEYRELWSAAGMPDGIYYCRLEAEGDAGEHHVEMMPIVLAR